MNISTFIVLCFGCFLAVFGKETQTSTSTRIIGGSLATISQYPFGVSISRNWGSGVFQHDCGGTILTTTAILSAAHCFWWNGVQATNLFQSRVGSSFASSGGTVHSTRLINVHPQYIPELTSSDIAVIRTLTSITYIPNAVAAGSIAGPNYVIADNQPLWASGWGFTSGNGPTSEQLRHIQVFSINQQVCNQRYAQLGRPITDLMMCSGLIDVGGAGTCTGDSGGPVVHNGVVVGVTSFGVCASPIYPDVNVRVSAFTAWITAAAQ